MIERLGKYRIDSILGKGAMGIVYKGFDPSIERAVALKTIRKEMFSEKEQADLISRFKNEAQAGGRLNHPNIVTVYDYGEDAESAYIAMEFVEGTRLDALLAPGRPIALTRVLTWMGDLLGGLEYAHSRGVVHRDVKPANLLITLDGRVKISDFGVAHVESSCLTQAGSIIGTPTYMSPEQFRGDTVDGRSDVFSAGIVLYQLLTGERPFSGSTSTVMQKILNEDPQPPSQVLAALGTRFDAVVAKSIRKRPDERFASARAFHEALLAAAEHATIDADARRLEDDDHTVLVTAKPASDTLPPPTQSGSRLASAIDGDNVTTWRREVFPEIEISLARQIGPMAKFLLKKIGDKAEGLDHLCELLLPHIPSEIGRIQFMDAAAHLKKKLDASGTGSGLVSVLSSKSRGLQTAPGASGGHAPEGFDDAYADATATRLVAIIGPIGRVLVKRTMKQTSDRNAFLHLLAGHIDDPGERSRFLADAGAARL